MSQAPSSVLISCQWDQCKVLLPSRDELLNHIRVEHIIPMMPMRKNEILLMKKLDKEKTRAATMIPGDDSRADASPTLEWPGSDDEGGGSRPQEHPQVTVLNHDSSPPRDRGSTFSTGWSQAPQAVMESHSENLNDSQMSGGCTHQNSMPQTQATYHSQGTDSSQ